MAKTKFTEELAEEICQVVSTSPKMLEEICAERDDWPTAKCIYEWRIKFPSFGERYARAKQAQIDPLVNHIFVLLRDDSKDYLEDDDGNKMINHVRLAKLKIEVDAIKWLASKLVPKLYGDRGQAKDNDDEDAISKVRID